MSTNQFNLIVTLLDGYSMLDIKYVWSKGNKSVGVQGDVTLPQFKIMGHEQESAIAALTTGNN